jgi:hypothetical protein
MGPWPKSQRASAFRMEPDPMIRFSGESLLTRSLSRVVNRAARVHEQRRPWESSGLYATLILLPLTIPQSIVPIAHVSPARYDLASAYSVPGGSLDLFLAVNRGVFPSHLHIEGGWGVILLLFRRKGPSQKVESTILYFHQHWGVLSAIRNLQGCCQD